MKRVFPFLLVLVFVLLGAIACNRDQVFKDRYRFKDNTWQRINEDIEFKVEITDESSRYDIDLPIRHASFYPHQFLEISFNMYAPSGQQSFNVQKIYLKDEKGNWKGDGMGDIWDFTYRMFDQYKFNEKGIYTIEIQNLTGNSMFLPGIMDLGLIIKKSKKARGGKE
jgi:gliding motility-associated lipoprotein GldH